MENRFNVIYRRWWFLTAASVVAVSLWTFAQVLALPMRGMAYQFAVLNTAWRQRVQGYCRQLAPDCQSVAFERHLLTTQLQDEPRSCLGGQTVVRITGKASAKGSVQDRIPGMVGHELEPMVRFETVQITGAAHEHFPG